MYKRLSTKFITLTCHSRCIQVVEMIAFESFFAISQPFFFYDPLNPYDQFQTPLTSGPKYFRALIQRDFVFLCLIYLIFGQLAQAYLGYSSTGNLLNVTESLAWCIVAMLSFAICLTSRLKGEGISRIIAELRRLYPEDAKAQEDAQVGRILNPLKTILRTFQKFYVITLGFKVLMPIGLIFYEGLVHQNWTTRLATPLYVWYPFQPNDFTILFVYVYEAWGAFLSTGPLMFITSLIGGMSSVFCVLLKDLAVRFGEFRTGNEQYLLSLRSLIQRHNELISLSEDMKEIFSSFLLVNYVCVSLGMSLFMFVTVASPNLGIVIEFVGDVICFNIYIGTLSYFGHRYIEHVSKMRFNELNE